LRDHDSFAISNGKWNWGSRGFGCRTATALNYLIEVRGFSFVDAVRELSGEDRVSYNIKPDSSRITERKPFRLPTHNRDNKRVIAYLRSRGIDKPLILDCIERGILYESAIYHNCVFVGRDENGKARFAAMRGTTGKFRRDVEGSDKRYGFILPPNNPDCGIIALFESAIDTLSHIALYPEYDCWRLSLGGTALTAFTHFLKRHSEITTCLVCTDNDEAGRRVASDIEEHLDIQVIPSFPQAGKDYNKMLLSVQRTERTVVQRSADGR
jgi:hypothetical protein